MRMETGLQMQQTMKLAPQVIQSIEILQLPTMALIEHIQQELEENPVLEEVSDSNSDEQKDEQSDQDDGDDADVQTDDEANNEFDAIAQMDDGWNDNFSSPGSSRRLDGEADPKQQAIENTAAKPMSFHEYLLEQLSLVGPPESLEELCEHIIYNVDNNGYFLNTLKEVVEIFENNATLDQAAESLKIVQSLEPPGVGARNLKECLLLQLDNKYKYYDLAKEVITYYLPLMESKKYQQIANRTNCDLKTMMDIIHFISALNPKPGSVFDSEVIPYVVPEVKIEKIDGKYEVILLNNNVPQIYINNYYSNVLNKKSSGAETYGYVQKKINAAKWLIDAIEQRRNTLRKVTGKIVDLQKKFFDEGVMHLKTLKMQEVADAIGMHVSTVSRAISQKYAQTPQGTYELKFFFTGGFKTEGGETESWETLRQKLADIVANEDKKSPLSDEDLMKQLKSVGVDIARRTITKYRRIMKIPSSRQRRTF